MDKYAIIACKQVGERCTGSGCFAAFNAATCKFEDRAKDAEMVSFLRCNGCGNTVDNCEDLKKKADRLLSIGVTVLHTSSCTKKKDSKEFCQLEIGGFCDYLAAQGVKIVKGTHHK